jgi:uncharacterized membrane protein
MLFIIALSLHVLAATFWAGSSFALARTGGLGIEQLRWPQLGAALVAILSGGYMGHLMHAGGFTRMQQVLMAGAACALVAAAIQAVAAARPSLALTAQRFAAGLLALAAVCMVVARHV